MRLFSAPNHCFKLTLTLTLTLNLTATPSRNHLSCGLVVWLARQDVIDNAQRLASLATGMMEVEAEAVRVSAAATVGF